MKRKKSCTISRFFVVSLLCSLTIFWFLRRSLPGWCLHPVFVIFVSAWRLRVRWYCCRYRCRWNVRGSRSFARRWTWGRRDRRVVSLITGHRILHAATFHLFLLIPLQLQQLLLYLGIEVLLFQCILNRWNWRIRINSRTFERTFLLVRRIFHRAVKKLS